MPPQIIHRVNCISTINGWISERFRSLLVNADAFARLHSIAVEPRFERLRVFEHSCTDRFELGKNTNCLSLTRLANFQCTVKACMTATAMTGKRMRRAHRQMAIALNVWLRVGSKWHQHRHRIDDIYSLAYGILHRFNVHALAPATIYCLLGNFLWVRLLKPFLVN